MAVGGSCARSLSVHLVVVAIAVGLGAPRASAHEVTVDGDASEWIGRTAPGENLAIVARAAGGAGELTFTDAIGDHRTDLSGAGAADLLGVSLTASAAGLALRVERGAGGGAQIQIAIDLDRTAGSGQTSFAGLADTVVADDARWEYLLQTQQSATIARVLDPSFAELGTVAIASLLGTTEILVPWSVLGLSGPPAGLRITVASFLEDPSTGDTLDIGGPGVSNAVDAVTVSGQPGDPSINTWAEVSDGAVDHALEAWLDAGGEVFAPLAIVRVAPGPSGLPGAEWVALRNQTAAVLPLDSFRLGDEETAQSGGEAMQSFPAGASIAPGATIVVARDAADFAARFGATADYEWGALDSSPAVPDLGIDAAWGSASARIALDDAGDELLVLDRADTIVDAVAYGSGIFEGVPAMAVPASTEQASREPVTLDDDAVDDFVLLGTCSLSDALSCSACTECGAALACDARPAGAACADGDPCDGAETCDGAGTCSASGTPLVCDDGNPCTDDTCAPATGCSAAPVALGTSCADGDLCDGAETCDGAGSCSASGTPPVCDDGNPCTDDMCAPALGCLVIDQPAGVVCADGDLCDGTETCDGAGSCSASGTPLACDDGNPCTTDACSPAGGCGHAPIAAGTSCADGDPCDGTETCDGAGTCSAGAPLACDDANPCTIDGCLSAIGCTHGMLPVGTPCADGDVCDGVETCDGAGGCAAGVPLDCADTNPCTVDSCAIGSGCAHAPAGAGTSCADADACDGVEICDGSGICAAGAVLDCDDGNPCTADLCGPTTGCAHAPLAAGTACSDGDPCTSGDACSASASCEGAPSCIDAGTPMLDAGAPVTDAGSDVDGGAELDGGVPDDAAVDADGGTPVPDAAIDADGGAPVTDAAVEIDAGDQDAGDDASVQDDAGLERLDATADLDSGGRGDGGPSERDAGAPSDGAGRCSCRAAGAPSSSGGSSGAPASLLGLGLLLAVLARRRAR